MSSETEEEVQSPSEAEVESPQAPSIKTQTHIQQSQISQSQALHRQRCKNPRPKAKDSSKVAKAPKAPKPLAFKQGKSFSAQSAAVKKAIQKCEAGGSRYASLVQGLPQDAVPLLMERQNFIETLQPHAQASTRTQLTGGIVEAARSVEKKDKILSGAARRKAASVFAPVIFEQFLSKTQKKTARSRTVDPKIVPVQNEDDEFEQFWKECEKVAARAWKLFSSHAIHCMEYIRSLPAMYEARSNGRQNLQIPRIYYDTGAFTTRQYDKCSRRGTIRSLYRLQVDMDDTTSLRKCIMSANDDEHLIVLQKAMLQMRLAANLEAGFKEYQKEDGNLSFDKIE